MNPTTPDLQGLIDSICSAQQPHHFGSRRNAILLMPGNYEGLRIPVGFYTQVLGLGASAATLNAKLAAGKPLLFTPGVCMLNDTLRVNNAKTV